MMILRLGYPVLLACSMMNAAPGPWDRFFNKPAVSAKQGVDLAMNHAVTLAFNPLSLKAAEQPSFPQLENQPASLAVDQTRACAIPLKEQRVAPEFFIGSRKHVSSALDPKILKASPIPACK